MTESRLREMLDRQHGVIAHYQLIGDGWSRNAIDRFAQRWRRVHQGVYYVGHGPLTDHQRWLAATLTTPSTLLSHAGAAAAIGCYTERGALTSVTRPGSGCRRRIGSLLVSRSKTLGDDAVVRDGIPMTRPERTVLDLLPYLDERAARRLVRDALRVGVVGGPSLRGCALRHRGRRGVALLKLYVDEYAALPALRTRSDAELLALAMIVGAGFTKPAVNQIVAGFEADLVWPALKTLIELDGPQWHQFESEDRRRDDAWRAAGWTVYRISTDDVYDRPQLLIDLVLRIHGHSEPNGQDASE